MSEAEAREEARRRGEVRGSALYRSYREALVDALVARDGLRCGICKNLLDKGAAQIDHIVPRSRGGRNEFDNIQLAHPGCNASKGEGHGFSDTELKELMTEWGQRRRARRREFDEGTVGRLDKRFTRTAMFRRVRLQITFTEEGLEMMEARRKLLNYGRGMSRSEFLEFLVRAYCSEGKAAKEFRRSMQARNEYDTEMEDSARRRAQNTQGEER